MRGKFWSLSRSAVSLAAKFCFIYPVILLLRAALFKDTGEITAFLVNLAIIFAGCIITSMIVKSRKNVLRLAISYLLSFVPGLILLLLFMNAGNLPPDNIYSLLRSIFEGLAAIILYLTGARSAVTNFDSVLGKKTVIAGGVIFLGAVIFASYYKEVEHLKNEIYYLICFFTALVLLIKNQQNLDRVFIRKHIELSMVPKDIRRYNSIIILIVFIVILALFNIKTIMDFIIMFLSEMPRYMFMVLFYIIYFLSKIMSDGESSRSQEQVESGMPVLPEGESSTVVSTVLTIVFGLLFLAAAIFLLLKLPRLLRIVGGKLGEIWEKILKLIKGLLGFQNEYREMAEDYVDEVEIIKPAAESKIPGKQEGIVKRIGRRLGKNLTLAEKVRLIYAGILRSIKAKGIVLSKSDTTGEIREKLPRDIGLGEMMDYITEVYDKVRYGEKAVENREFEFYKDKSSQVADILKSKP